MPPDGLRIDAAKHIQQVDLDEILDRVNTTRAGEGGPLPYVFLEFVGNCQGEAFTEQRPGCVLSSEIISMWWPTLC